MSANQVFCASPDSLFTYLFIKFLQYQQLSMCHCKTAILTPAHVKMKSEKKTQ